LPPPPPLIKNRAAGSGNIDLLNLKDLVNLKLPKKLSILLITVLFIFGSNSAFSQSGAKWATGLNSISSGDGFGTSNNYPVAFYTNNTAWMWLTTNGYLGINNNNPSYRLDVQGGFHSENAHIDSLLSAGGLIVNGNSQLNGLLNIGSTLTLDGTNNSISSSTGTVDFLNSNILTTANITADTITGNVINANYFSTGQGLLNSLQVTGQTQTGSLLVGGDATVNGTTSLKTLYADSIDAEMLDIDMGYAETWHAQTGNVQTLHATSMHADTINTTSINSGQYLLNGSPLTGSQWISSGSDIYYTGGNVGININNPQYPLHIDGNAVVTGSITGENLYVEKSVNIGAFKFINGAVMPGQKDTISSPAEIVIHSLANKIQLKSDTVEAQKLMRAQELNAYLVSTDKAVTKEVEAGKVRVDTSIRIAGGGISIDGINNLITSTSGNIYFHDENLITTGSIASQDLYVQRAINIGDFEFKNGATLPGQKDTIKSTVGIVLESAAEMITFSSDSVIAKEVIKAKTIKADTLKTESLETGKEIRVKGMVIDGTNSRITSNSGSINFDDENLITTGSIGGQNLYAQNSLNIGPFKFINGAILPGQKDTIKSPAEIVVRSEAEKISLESDTVTAKNVLEAQTLKTATLSAGTIKSDSAIKVAGSGLVIDGINNKITSASGTISFDDEDLVTTGTINTSDLNVSGLTSFNRLHVVDSLKIGNSVWIGGVDPGIGVDNRIYASDGDLFLQSQNAYNSIISLSNNSHMGLGIDNPQKKLHIKTIHGGVPSSSESHQGIRLEDIYTTNTIPYNIISSSVWDIEPRGKTGDLYIGTLDDTVMTLSDTGNVQTGSIGININNPKHHLHIHSNITYTGSGLNDCCSDPIPPPEIPEKDIVTLQLTNLQTGSGETDGLLLGVIGNTGFMNLQEDNNIIIATDNGNLFFETNDVVRMNINPSGNVGIGTTSPHPANKLEVVNTIGLWSGSDAYPVRGQIDQNGGTLYISENTYYSGGWQKFESSSGSSQIRLLKTGEIIFLTGHGSDPNQGIKRMRIDENGNVGIGIGSDDIPDGFMLAVCGNIKAKEVEVDATWCDYVFDENYERMSWQEKAEFIKENKHLPGIDPGKKIEEEGLSVGKTMAGITLNVEENRLDITDLYKMYYELKEENAMLKQLIIEGKN
ncbi:MAG: hypothetical protein ABII90_02730, partial [Bacteroidota bacterium]